VRPDRSAVGPPPSCRSQFRTVRKAPCHPEASARPARAALPKACPRRARKWRPMAGHNPSASEGAAPAGSTSVPQPTARFYDRDAPARRSRSRCTDAKQQDSRTAPPQRQASPSGRSLQQRPEGSGNAGNLHGRRADQWAVSASPGAGCGAFHHSRHNGPGPGTERATATDQPELFSQQPRPGRDQPPAASCLNQRQWRGIKGGQVKRTRPLPESDGINPINSQPAPSTSALQRRSIGPNAAASASSKASGPGTCRRVSQAAASPTSGLRWGWCRSKPGAAEQLKQRIGQRLKLRLDLADPAVETTTAAVLPSNSAKSHRAIGVVAGSEPPAAHGARGTSAMARGPRRNQGAIKPGGATNLIPTRSADRSCSRSLLHASHGARPDARATKRAAGLSSGVGKRTGSANGRLPSSLEHAMQFPGQAEVWLRHV